jgi:hypothetical protein
MQWNALTSAQCMQEMRRIPWSTMSYESPRICVMSGMTGEEQVAVASVWERFAGSKGPIFGAVVPNIANKPLRAVITVCCHL